MSAVRAINASERPIFLRSALPLTYRDELERLFFFNRKQRRIASRITQSVVEYGKPVLVEKLNEIILCVPTNPAVQTVYILDGDPPEAALLGVLLYARTSFERVTVLHVAFHEHCSRLFKQEGINVPLMAISRLLDGFKRIQGLQELTIFYSNTKYTF